MQNNRFSFSLHACEKRKTFQIKNWISLHRLGFVYHITLYFFSNNNSLRIGVTDIFVRTFKHPFISNTFWIWIKFFSKIVIVPLKKSNIVLYAFTFKYEMPQVKKEILVHWIDNFFESQVFEMYLGALWLLSWPIIE